MINCNEITQELEELKMKMTSCSRLYAEDLQHLIDLIISLDQCKCDCSSTLINGIYLFQFNNLDLQSDVNSISNLDSTFLETNGSLIEEDTLINGSFVELTNTARFGFAITNSTASTPYTILDNFNIDITLETFDTYFDETNDIFYYVSKEYYTPSSLYFKFINNA